METNRGVGAEGRPTTAVTIAVYSLVVGTFLAVDRDVATVASTADSLVDAVVAGVAAGGALALAFTAVCVAVGVALAGAPGALGALVGVLAGTALPATPRVALGVALVAVVVTHLGAYLLDRERSAQSLRGDRGGPY
jgi:hypothetical protein